jgi:hypothetical protein
MSASRTSRRRRYASFALIYLASLLVMLVITGTLDLALRTLK